MTLTPFLSFFFLPQATKGGILNVSKKLNRRALAKF